MDPNPWVHPGIPRMFTAVPLAASHRDDLRCDHFNSSRSSRRQVQVLNPRNGPRSFTRTFTDLPLRGLPTTRQVPNRRVL